VGAGAAGLHREQAEKFSFDVLDPTKIVPEELVPLLPVGRLVLDRNPDNFFAETEQVAFCAAHVEPASTSATTRCSPGRIHSYVDTQITRLGGPNFHEIPINAPIAPVAQQPARRPAPPGHPPRARGLRAELAGRRLPVPGRRAGLRVVPAAGAGGQAARQAGEISPSTKRRRRCSTKARARQRRRISPVRSASSSAS
jgi:hypothetical protein